MSIPWLIIRKKQVTPLNKIMRETNCKALLISTKDKELIVVHPSPHDNRRWDIDEQGNVTARDRKTGAPLNEEHAHV